MRAAVALAVQPRFDESARCPLSNLRGIERHEAADLQGIVDQGSLRAFLAPRPKGPTTWRVLGREIIEKMLPSPARAAALIAAVTGSGSFAQAADSVGLVVKRGDLIPLAIGLAAISVAAAVSSRMKVPGTAKGLSHLEAKTLERDLAAGGSISRQSAQVIAQDSKRVATALVTPLEALASLGMKEAIEQHEFRLLVGLVHAADRGDFTDPLPKGIMGIPGLGEALGDEMSTGRSPAVRSAFREEVGRWLADADHQGEDRPDHTASVCQHLESTQPGELRVLLEMVDRSLANTALRPGDLTVGPAHSVGLIIDRSLRYRDGHEPSAFRSSALAALRFGRAEDFERLSRVTRRLIVEGDNMDDTAARISDVLRLARGRNDIRRGDAEKVESVIREVVKDTHDLSLEPGISPWGEDSLASPSMKAEFLKAFDAFEGVAPAGLANLAHLIQKYPAQGVDVVTLTAARMELDQLKERLVHASIGAVLDDPFLGPATDRQLRMMGSLEQQFLSRGLSIPASLQDVLAHDRSGWTVSMKAAQLALAEARISIIVDERRTANVPRPRKEQE